jgi:hypothetical protein
MHIDYELSASDLPQECIDDCSSSGDVTEAVEYWVNKLGFTVDRERAIDCLKGFGAWTHDELCEMESEEIAMRVLWVACGQFSDEQVMGEGDPVFVLES